MVFIGIDIYLYEKEKRLVNNAARISMDSVLWIRVDAPTRGFISIQKVLPAFGPVSDLISI
jgi:hypothetical protein